MFGILPNYCNIAFTIDIITMASRHYRVIVLLCIKQTAFLYNMPLNIITPECVKKYMDGSEDRIFFCFHLN